MNNTIKRFLCSIICMLFVFVAFGHMNAASAESCKHDYGNTDICKKCGNIRIHEFEYAIPFYTIKDGVPVWSKPTKNSKCVETYAKRDTLIDIDGILRNQYGNIWFRVAKSHRYVFIDNLYLDFGTLALQNYQRVTSYEQVLQNLAEFYNIVKEGGRADYKRWLDPGNKKIAYTVRFISKSGSNYYSMTAEELGNIHYGFLARAIGLNRDLILYSGGIVNQFGHLNWKYIQPHLMSSLISCVGKSSIELYPVCVLNQTTIGILEDIYSECSASYCDEATDAANVEKGIDYYDTGDFSW